jgi:hypothetical protein
MKRNLGQYISYLAIALLVLFLIGQCKRVGELNSDIAKLENYKDTVKFYKSKSGRLIAYNDALVVDRRTLEKVKDSLMEEIKDLNIKKPDVIVRWRTRVDVDTKYVAFETKLPCDEDFEASFKFDDKWLAFDGVVVNTGVRMDRITLENDLMFVVGEKKNGLFKRNEYIVAVKSDNPYFQTESIQSYVIKPKPKFYDRLWFKASLFVLGVGTGIAISK